MPGTKIIAITLAGISAFTLYFAYAKGEAEGTFSSCRFATDEEALSVAEREFLHTIRHTGKYSDREFQGEIENLGVTSDGGKSVTAIFTSDTVPNLTLRMYLAEDCTQALSMMAGS